MYLILVLSSTINQLHNHTPKCVDIHRGIHTLLRQHLQRKYKYTYRHPWNTGKQAQQSSSSIK